MSGFWELICISLGYIMITYAVPGGVVTAIWHAGPGKKTFGMALWEGVKGVFISVILGIFLLLLPTLINGQH